MFYWVIRMQKGMQSLEIKGPLISERGKKFSILLPMKEASIILSPEKDAQSYSLIRGQHIQFFVKSKGQEKV